MSEEKVNYRQIDFDEAIQMIAKKECGNLYLQKNAGIEKSTNFTFPLQKLHEYTWFRKEIVS
ncbi:hypothetical protein JCM19037_3690 [Geomicrobium sp. JCM 19037]|uniref:hypothetical protein n=1 Tax=Geomicrobium sp. JCM 19037 TaxID=1460634 RepID=UPI00045F48F8|nr:hypothetical protein [Geomicrobium sp. JCM 19037]GAK05211.1 hypothetical protein JCM19037_3690 [Geomicrobium sp. JCM 19037]